jgi:putative salt-induced outer membrane protein YdiY
MLNWIRRRICQGLSWSWLLLLGSSSEIRCCADNIVLHLKNGDQITGLFISETTNLVILTTSFSEQLKVPKDLIKRRESIEIKEQAAPANTNQSNASPAPRPPLVPATGIASELVPTNKPIASVTKTNASVAKGPPPSSFRKFLSEWRGEAQLGANLGFSTVNREAFTGHLKLTENHKFAETDSVLRNILEYNVAYGKTDHTLSDDRMEGSIKTEYEITKRFLVYNAAVAGYDTIRSIDLQYDFGPGVGYKWIMLTNFVFKTELGGDYQEQYFSDHTQTRRFSLRLDEDFWWQVSAKIKWDEKLEFFPEVDSLFDYRLRFETNLSYLLKENLTLSLNVIDQYDTRIPAGSSKNDLQVRSLLGIKF